MPKFEIFKAIGGYAWRFKAGNGETLCHSEVYVSKQGAIHAVSVMKQLSGVASIYDLTT